MAHRCCQNALHCAFIISFKSHNALPGVAGRLPWLKKLDGELAVSVFEIFSIKTWTGVPINDEEKELGRALVLGQPSA